MNIALVNQSTRVSANDFADIVAAIQIQMDTQVAPAWDRLPPLLVIYPSRADVPAGEPALILADDCGDPQALGYHTEGPDGAYWGIIGVNPVLDNSGGVLDGGTAGVSVASVISHEAIELWGDEAVNVWADGPAVPQGSCYSFELCDPVEGSLYSIILPSGRDVWVSDWVGPRWFDQMAPKGSFLSYCGGPSAPFQLAPGGYMVVRQEPGSEQQVFHATARPPAWRMAMKAHGRTSRRMGAPATGGAGQLDLL